MSASTAYLLAIDLGTSGPKVALFDSEGASFGSELEPVPLHLSEGGGAEQEPEDWWRAIVTAARRLLAKHPEKVAGIVGVGCTAQWSGTVAVDGAGKPLGRAVIWMDSRGARHIKELTAGFPSIQGYGAAKLLRWVRLTGGIPAQSGKDSLAHILYLAAEHPDLYARAQKFLEPKDYLNFRLTGRIAASFDSIALHWVTDNRDPDAVKYDAGLLKATGLRREQLPDLARAIDVLGPVTPEVARELGIPETAKVVLGSPDVHSAAVGSGAVRDFDAHLYIGTSSWLTCHVPFKKTDPVNNMATLVSAIPGRYLIGNSQECAGVCLTYLRDNVVFADDALRTGPPPANAYALFDQVAEQVPAGSGNVLFTPWLYGERTPIEDARIRGGFHNVSLQTTRAQLVRAVFEGVALNTRWLFEAVKKFAGRPFEAVSFIGGGARSALWCQIHADVLGVPIRQVADPVEANARGAAMIAAVGLGLTRYQDVPAKVAIARTFDPHDGHRALYDRHFSEFVKLYRANRAIHARLNAPAR